MYFVGLQGVQSLGSSEPATVLHRDLMHSHVRARSSHRVGSNAVAPEESGLGVRLFKPGFATCCLSDDGHSLESLYAFVSHKIGDMLLALSIS